MTPALLGVDAIRAFFDPDGLHFYPEAREVEAPIARLLDAAREHDRLVVHAVDRHRPGLRDFAHPKLPEHCPIDGPDTEFLPPYSPE